MNLYRGKRRRSEPILLIHTQEFAPSEATSIPLYADSPAGYTELPLLTIFFVNRSPFPPILDPKPQGDQSE